MKHRMRITVSSSQCIGCCLVLICLLLYDGRVGAETDSSNSNSNSNSTTQIYIKPGSRSISTLSKNNLRSLGISNALSRALGGGGGGGGIGAGSFNHHGNGGPHNPHPHINENEESIEKDSGEGRPVPTIRRQTNLTASGKIVCRKKKSSNRSTLNSNKKKPGKGNIGKNPSKVSIKEIIRQYYIQSDPEPTYLVDALHITDPFSLRTAGLLRVLIRSVTDLIAGIIEPLGINNAIFRPLAGSRGRVFGFVIGQRLYEVRMVSSRGKRVFTFQRLIVLKGYQSKHVLRRYVYENEESVECLEENQTKTEKDNRNDEVNLLEWLNSGPNVFKIKWDYTTGLKREPEKELEKRLVEIEIHEMQIRDRQLEDDDFVEQEIIRRADKHKEKDPEEKEKQAKAKKEKGKKKRRRHRLGKEPKIERGASTSLLQDVEDKARKILSINTFEIEEDEPQTDDSSGESTTEKTTEVLMREVALIDQELLALAPKIEKVKLAREIQGPTLSFSEQQFLLEEERLLTAAYNSKKKELSQKLGLIDPNAKLALDQLPSQTVPTSVKLLAHKKKQHYAQGLILMNGFTGLKDAGALKDLVAFEKFREVLSQGKGEEQAVADLISIIMKAKGLNADSGNPSKNNTNVTAALEDAGLAKLTGLVKSIGIDKLINPDYILSLTKLGRLAVSAGEIVQNIDDLKRLNTLVETFGNLTALSELSEKAGSLKKLANLAYSVGGISNLLNISDAAGGLKRLSHTVDKAGGVSKVEEALSSADKYLRLLKTTKSVTSLLKLLKFTHSAGSLLAFSNAVEKLGGEKKLEEVVQSGGGITEFSKLLKAARGFVELKELAMPKTTDGSGNSIQKLKEQTGANVNVTKFSRSLQNSGDWSELQSLVIKRGSAYSAFLQLFEPTPTEREQEETTHYSRVIKESHGLSNLQSLSEIAGGSINLIELSKETGGVERLVLLSATMGGLPQLLELAQRDGGLAKYTESLDQLSPLLSTNPSAQNSAGPGPGPGPGPGLNSNSNFQGLSSLITRDNEGFNGLMKLSKISQIYPILQKLEESKEREERTPGGDFISKMGGIKNVLELNKTVEGNLKLQRYARDHDFDLSKIHDVIADADDHFRLIKFVEEVGGVYYVQQLVEHAGGLDSLIERAKRASLFEEMREVAGSAEALETLEEAADTVGGLLPLTTIVNSVAGLRKLKSVLETEEGQERILEELKKIKDNSADSEAVLKLANVTEKNTFWPLAEFVDRFGGLSKIQQIAESTGGLKQLSLLSKKVDGLLNLKQLLDASGGLSKLNEAAQPFGGLTELHEISKRAGGFDKFKQLASIVGGFEGFQKLAQRGGGVLKLFTLTKTSGGFAQLLETAKIEGALEKLTKLAEKKGGYIRLIERVKKAGGLKIFVTKLGEDKKDKGKAKEAAGSQESSEES